MEVRVYAAKQLTSIRDQTLCARGRPHASACADKELVIKHGPQSRQRATDSRLTHPQQISGRGDASGLVSLGWSGEVDIGGGDVRMEKRREDR